jgi:N6-L-threonylcarbamoyladenine synthase
VFPLLAIETSCDETAAAVLGPGHRLLANVVRSQIDQHALFGGVVPELASRCHLESVGPVVDEALRVAGCSRDDLQAVAATRGPGLVGCLLVGLSYAQGLAVARGLPILGVNHLEGHLLAPFVGMEQPPFPFVALVVSGGHTELLVARDVGDYEILGATRDDAAGEAFDKSARLLGLPYPGGMAVDRLARDGDRDSLALPRGMMHKGEFDFSFSGLKTAVWQHVQREGIPSGQALHDFCASLQEAIVEVLVHKTRRAVRHLGLDRVVVSGGVAANSRLRSALAAMSVEEGWTLHQAPLSLCTDNAGMIGYVASLRMARGERSPLGIGVAPGLSLAEAADQPRVQPS